MKTPLERTHSPWMRSGAAYRRFNPSWLDFQCFKKKRSTTSNTKRTWIYSSGLATWWVEHLIVRFQWLIEWWGKISGKKWQHTVIKHFLSWRVRGRWCKWSGLTDGVSVTRNIDSIQRGQSALKVQYKPIRTAIMVFGHSLLLSGATYPRDHKIVVKLISSKQVWIGHHHSLMRVDSR